MSNFRRKNPNGPERSLEIKKVHDLLLEYLTRYPMMRFGQVISNALGENVFYYEDDVLIEYLEEALKES